MMELKRCPFCGEPGKLRRATTSYKTNPTAIMDEWVVECLNRCCRTKAFKSEIFQDENGNVVINNNGAEQAVNAWNERNG